MVSKKLSDYKAPVYPSQDYQYYHTNKNQEKVLASVLGLLLLNSKCSTIGESLPPKLISEESIRSIVDKVFMEEGI
jgi:hypothetical protein